MADTNEPLEQRLMQVRMNLFWRIWYRFFEIPATAVILGRSGLDDRPILFTLAKQYAPEDTKVTAIWFTFFTIEKARDLAAALNRMADQMELNQKE